MDAHLRTRRQQLEHARSRFDADDRPAEERPAETGAAGLDPAVERSWSRCAPTVTTQMDAVPVDTEHLEESWQESPIRRAMPDLESQLEAIAADGDFVAAVTDPTGRILWSWGGRSMRRRAEQVNFVAGGRWDEGSAGTNALGLALIRREPTAVFSMEHWCDAVHDWVCYSAPVLGPDREPLGVIDLSTKWQRATPLALTTVTALARLVQFQVQASPMAAPALDHSPAAPFGRTARPVLELRLLGNGSATLGGTPLLLTRRQLEILAVLSGEDGVSLDELQAHVYGDRSVSTATVRAEVSHLRQVLGGAITTRRYRLDLPVRGDLFDLEDGLRTGDLHAAVERYVAQLLPTSESPWITDRRHRCDVSLRNALLASGTTAELLSFADVHPDDIEVLEAAAARAQETNPLGPVAAARLSVALDRD